jgi:ABC-type bacteriocin/lantibiotic exporter with double-glycine peptidase domain|tara:strand:- start:407 stop:697 length:291 start_codon:yes stop_codon:yes gene_type:complete
LRKPIDEAEEMLNWPSNGKLELKNVTACYRENLDPSLVNVNLVFEGGEKIGVVGRTGSGKSTLLQVFFRILDKIDGGMEIDGVETTTLGLHKLRGE